MKYVNVPDIDLPKRSEYVIEFVPFYSKNGDPMLLEETDGDCFLAVVKYDGALFRWHPVPTQVVDSVMLLGLLAGVEYLVSRNSQAKDKVWKVKKWSE